MINGESIPVVQKRIADAGVNGIDIIPVGADKVFLRSLSEVNITTLLHDAKEFFDHFFTNIVRWEKKVVSFQQGVLVRLYGIPLHAWNECFFKLCIMECGRFIRTDSCSTEKERFDYARVLITTSSTEVINCSESLMIDGDLVSLKIVEEWGFNLGDDVCLYEEDAGSSDEQSIQEDVRLEHDFEDNADLLVDKIVHDLVESDGHSRTVEDRAELSTEVVSASIPMKSVHQGASSKSANGSSLDISMKVGDHLKESELGFTCGEQLVQGVDIVTGPQTGAGSGPLEEQRRGRAISYPPGAARSVVSGPWSLEWLRDQVHSEAGVVSSSRRVGHKGMRPKLCRNNEVPFSSRRKKVAEFYDILFTA